MLSFKDNRETITVSIKKILKIVAISCLLIFAIAACEKKGPMEKAGESADHAIDDAGEAIEESGDKVKKETSK